MAAHTQPADIKEAEDQLLAANPHWQLVERILASEGFQRATQLRNLLRYISRNSLLHPEIVLREYEIACDVLGRRPDFDPTRDNIARAQVSHLRRKLDLYFQTDGSHEPVVLIIQKGSYTPVFRPASVQSASLEQVPLAAARTVSPSDAEQTSDTVNAPALSHFTALVRKHSILPFTLLFVAIVGAAYFLGRHEDGVPAKPSTMVPGNAFVQFLGRSQGSVTIVVPDLSLLMVRRMSGSEISISDYTSLDYPKRQLAGIGDQAIRDKLLDLAAMPNTTINEAMIGFDFKQAIQTLGLRADIRYARTLHVEDLSQGNSLLIGGGGSNLWTSLFSGKMNFRFVEVNDHLHYFENALPLPGELSRYNVTYPSEAKVAVGYVDIALTQNPTRTGYILLINGSDLQASEAATRYLLHGNLPPEISSMLGREDLRYFEILLRGRHIGQEAEDNVDLVAVRQ